MNAETQQKNAVATQLLYSMYGLRHRTFKNRLGWKVADLDGYESDEFDDLDPVYSYITDREQVVACTRLLPTTGNYMLKDVFPDLARGETIPQQSDVWEISRFAIDKAFSRSYKGLISSATFEIFRSLYTHAVERDVRAYVIVTTTAAERVMKLMGLPIRRFGDGQPTDLDGVQSVALWLDVNPDYARVVLD